MKNNIYTDRLIKRAKEASDTSKWDREGKRIGVALLTDKYEIFTGMDIMISNHYIPAEIDALLKVTSKGIDVSSIITLVRYSSYEIPEFPRGEIRQLLFECNPDMTIIKANNKQKIKSNIKRLLPD